MINQIKIFKFHFILFTLSLLILTPLISALSGNSQALVILVNFTLLVIAGFMTAERKIPKLLTIILGSMTLISVWCDFFAPLEIMFSLFRMWSSLALFCLLSFILINNIKDAPEIHLSVILGAMAGFILLGLIGGVAFEIMEYLHPGSILLSIESTGYDFYYYSFISLITVGYGDVIPLSGAAKSLSIVISLIGQFYLTIGIALFVGKYLNHINIK